MSAEERAAAARTRLIDHNLKMDGLKAKKDIKLLLLGACENVESSLQNLKIVANDTSSAILFVSNC